MILKKSKQFKILPHSIMYFIILAVTVVCVYPLIWLLTNSFKHQRDLFLNPWGLPLNPNLDAYINAFSRGNIPLVFFNSLFLCVVAGAISIFFCISLSYGIGRMKWKLSKPVEMLFLAGYLVPFPSIALPLFITFTRIGLVNTRISLIIPIALLCLPVPMMLMIGFLKTVPIEIEYAAMIDGCSLFKNIVVIVLPLLKPAIVTILILNFLAMWNEMTLGIFLISDSKLFTVPLGAMRFRDQYTLNYPPLMAYMTITIAVTSTIFLLFHKQIMAGVVDGAVKG